MQWNTCSIARRAVRLVFMLLVMVTSLSEGGVASRTPRSGTGAAAAASCWGCSDSSDTFKHSLTHLHNMNIIATRYFE